MIGINLDQIIETQSPIFIIGNGINRYPNNPPEISWNKVVIELATKYTGLTTREIPAGISLLEVVDLIQINKEDHKKREFLDDFLKVLAN